MNPAQARQAHAVRVPDREASADVLLNDAERAAFAQWAGDREQAGVADWLAHRRSEALAAFADDFEREHAADGDLWAALALADAGARVEVLTAHAAGGDVDKLRELARPRLVEFLSEYAVLRQHRTEFVREADPRLDRDVADMAATVARVRAEVLAAPAKREADRAASRVAHLEQAARGEGRGRPLAARWAAPWPRSRPLIAPVRRTATCRSPWSRRCSCALR